MNPPSRFSTDPGLLLEHAPWGVVMVGDDGNVKWLNAAFERCSGLAPDKVIALSEASFEASMRSIDAEHTRVEVSYPGLRSIHYFRPLDHRHSPLALSRVAEELREPLASIYGFAELLLTQNYDEDLRRELTATLLEQVESMLNIINDKLDLREPSVRRPGRQGE